MTGRGQQHAVEGVSVLTSPDEVRQVRSILALGGVPGIDLEDGVQQVRLKLLERQAKPGTAEIRNPIAWLSVVASRVAVDWHRGRAKDTDLHARLSARWERQPPAQRSEDDRLLALTLAEVLEELPANQRQILTLRFYADLSVPDIAKALDIPEGTAKSRLHTAVSTMRTRLREKDVI